MYTCIPHIQSSLKSIILHCIALTHPTKKTKRKTEIIKYGKTPKLARVTNRETATKIITRITSRFLPLSPSTPHPGVLIHAVTVYIHTNKQIKELNYTKD